MSENQSKTEKNAQPGFFANLVSKAKKLLNIGGAKVKIDMDPVISSKGKSLKGKLLFTCKDETTLDNIEIKIEETITETKSTAQGPVKKSKTHLVGNKVLEGFTMKAGSEKVVHFDVSYSLISTNADDLKDMGGVFGAIGKLSSMANKQEKTFIVRVFGNIKGSFGTVDSMKLTLE